MRWNYNDGARKKREKCTICVITLEINTMDAKPWSCMYKLK